MVSVERERVQSFGRLEEGLSGASDWYEWGPYLSERAWGTVREDYSPGGMAWDYFPHDHARSKAYRWNEDGLAGLSDICHRLCFALALWNGRDPILKERPFGLTGTEGNHGEDVKEYWWYLDALPSSAWLRWRYFYPQRTYPYEDLLAETRRRGRLDPEYELLDTGVFAEDRYWRVDVDYAKADPADIAIRIRVANAGPDADSLHVLPTLWFRNVWSWDVDVRRPQIHREADALRADHEELGVYRLSAAPATGHPPPEPLFCDNDTNGRRLYGADGPPYPKDGINDHVVRGAATVNPAAVGTKAAWHYVLRVPAGQTAELRLRLRRDSAEGLPPDWSGPSFDALFARREAEANEFYAELTPADASDEEAQVMRQAFAGMLWGKQFYSYDVARWLDGDPAQPRPPDSRRQGRNTHWRHLDAFDVLSMPDPWEYPWFAAWDLAFHTVTLAHIDPAFAKYQLAVLCREWFLHPNGALPAYEWSFDDVNPPVHAWATLKVYLIDGSQDREFLEKVVHKLLLNFTWWVNRQDAEGNSLFEGGFLGLDNVGPLDRSHLPPGVLLEQADGTAWMAAYCLAMLRIALELAASNPAYEPLATKFFEHFALITDAVNTLGLWDASDGFFYDQVVRQGRRQPVRVRSIVGILPILAATSLPAEEVAGLRDVRKQFAGFLAHRTQNETGTPATVDPRLLGAVQAGADPSIKVLSLVTLDQLRRILAELLDEQSFLSPYGLRSLSRRHRESPITVDLDGLHASIDYEPAESTTGMFGGNSNWRGPVWFPVNYLIIEALGRFSHYLGDSVTVEFPVRSGRQATLAEVAADLRRRLISLFLTGPDGRRPANGWVAKLQNDPAWRQGALFYEYFSGDNGAGLGASHQTGWTGLVADLIVGRRLPGLA